MNARCKQAMRRALTAMAGAIIALGWAAASAAADVSVDAVLPQGDGTVVIIVALEGGCVGGARTTGLTVELPASSAVLGASERDGWKHVSIGRRVEFSGPGVAGTDRAEFILTARVGGQAGDLVRIPAVQTCEGGLRQSWTQADPGSDFPTPSFVATQETIDPSMTILSPADSSSGASGRQVAVAVVVFVAGAVLVEMMMGRHRRRARP